MKKKKLFDIQHNNPNQHAAFLSESEINIPACAKTNYYTQTVETVKQLVFGCLRLRQDVFFINASACVLLKKKILFFLEIF